MENQKTNIDSVKEFLKTLNKQELSAIEDYGSQMMKDNIKYKAKIQSDLQQSFKEFMKSKK